MAPSRADIQDFDSVYQSDANFKYRDAHQILEVELHRARERFGGKLFFDRLLETIGIDGKRVYPPRELRKLYASIIETDAPQHFKQALIFYLLKDLEALPGNRAAAQFAEDCYLPNKSLTFIEGLHNLDRLQFEPAMENLTSPSIDPQYAPEILTALLNAEKHQLALAYYQTVSPSLADHNLLRQYFTMLVETGCITEAFYFSRTQPNSTRRGLLEILIAQSGLAAKTKQQRADQGIELVDLPFDAEEEAWFEHFLLRDTEGRRRAHGADMVTMRRIANGRFAQAKEDFHAGNLSKTQLNDVTWANVMDGLDKGLGPRNATDIYEHDHD